MCDHLIQFEFKDQRRLGIVMIHLVHTKSALI